MLTVDLDGTGGTEIATGVPVLRPHARRARPPRAARPRRAGAKGDLEVDAHHTVEDVGICLGQALARGARRQARHPALRLGHRADGRGARAAARSTSPAAPYLALRRRRARSRSSARSTPRWPRSSSRALATNAGLTLHLHARSAGRATRTTSSRPPFKAFAARAAPERRGARSTRAVRAACRSHEGRRVCTPPAVDRPGRP